MNKTTLVASLFFVTMAVSSRAQGIVYLSNLEQPSAGSLAVGNDSWLAAAFQTGNNAAGYMLNSVQLAMTDASGSPTGFRVMLYNNVGNGGFIASPGGNLVTLNGSLDPALGAIFTYTPAANFTLSPDYQYFVVLTAGTTVASGAYEWSYAGVNSYNPSDGWSNQGGVWASSDGSIPAWNLIATFPQFAITASAIPEPATLGLLSLGALLFIRHRRKHGRLSGK